MKKIVFDTNVFRDIQRTRIEAAAVARAVERLKHEAGMMSPLSLIELGSHICEAERQDFDRYHGALQAAQALCTGALPDPEAVLRERVFAAPPDGRGLPPSETLDLTKIIAQAASYDALVTGQVARWQGVLSKVSYNAGYLRQFREDYEHQYVQDMHDWVVGMFCPDWQAKRSAGKMAYLDDEPLRKLVLGFLDSEDFKKEFYRLQADRVGVHLPTKQAWDSAGFALMEPFFRAYLWILKNIVNAGYNPQKNKNDFNDIHFLLYLADPDVVLVTRDGGIVRKLDGHDRVKTFEQWLAMI